MESNTITVSVTDDDIAKGKRMDGSFCPIARALRRALPKADWVSVGMTNATYESKPLFRKRRAYNAPLSREAKRFINDFDSGLTVHPTEFQFEFRKDEPLEIGL